VTNLTIALLTDGIWPFVVGGMQRHSYYLCKYLSQNGVTVELYHTTRTGLRPNLSECFTDAELSNINQHFIQYPSQADKWPGHYLRTSYRYSENIYYSVLANREIDIIYAKGLTGWKLLKEKQKGAKFPPICINVHGYEYYQKAASFRNKLEQIMLRPAFKYINTHADFIYSYGWPISKIIRDHIPNLSHRIIEIPTGVEAEIIRQGPMGVNRTRNFVFIGRYERRKGVPELLEAIRRIDSQFDFRFHFIGEIPENLKIKTSNVIYHGLLGSKWQIKEVLEDCDILVCPSFAEGMPNVILEGMAAGCAIIASNVGAVPLMVSESNGWMVEAGSVDDLAAKLVLSINLNDDELLEKKEKSLEMINNTFRWDKVITSLVGSFNQIVSQYKKRSVSEAAEI
jgi:glycosyltransferase involved in cell wall biosynthesis